ncbi:unnamed protein product [Rotaria sp. Silwood1]|nr:unnamed protein product [Rotaria sp. Silwood1]
MLKTTIILLIHINILFAATPNWVGTFNVDRTCDRNKCCCFDGQIVITSRNPNTLTLTAGVTGAAAYCGISHTLTFPKPIGFRTTITSDGDKMHFHLSNDGTHLSIDYEQEDFMRCAGNAVRTQG